MRTMSDRALCRTAGGAEAGKAGRRALTAAVALALCLLLCGCVISQSGERESVSVYRLCEPGVYSGSESLMPEQVYLSAGESELQAVVRGLNSPSQDGALRSAFPGDVRILDCRLARGCAQIYMNREYLLCSGVERVMADYAAVYSLTALDQVTSVDIMYDETCLAHGMTAEDAAAADTLYAASERQVKLFVPDMEALGLRSRTEYVTADGEHESYELVLNALISALSREGILPERTSVRSVKTRDGVCTVNLSEELYTTEPEYGYAARLVIGSIVNTLTYLPGIDGVSVQVGGVPMASYGSYITVWPMHFDENLMIYGEVG